ncbi:hypothetical protein DPMN_193620 [Dreissena polymorpha]|uniref:Uncharacterized protein n=1 Tax=Dreissena polymorpha TaxID=45954 RepID=A0A9D3XZP3_DREPO|nr:hypothetical protein DPMN_193620 [Dreissena polymorpha]
MCRLDSELGGAQWNTSSTSETLFNTCKSNVGSSTNSSTERECWTACGMILRGIKIDEGLMKVIKKLYENASDTVLFNEQMGDFVRTTVGVRLTCSI